MVKFVASSKNLLKGLSSVFKHLFRNAVTEEYPEVKPELNENFRGKHVLNDNCTACGLCKKVCPANAISIKKDENNKLVSYKIDYGKCIFCGNCVYYCPNKSIQHTTEFELAITAEQKDDLISELKQEEKNGRN